MKKIMTVVFLTVTSVFAQLDFNEEVLEFEEKIYMHNITCVTSIGGSSPAEDRIRTILRGLRLQSKEIELKHEQASVKGCELNTLDQMLDDSHMLIVLKTSGLASLRVVAMTECL